MHLPRLSSALLLVSLSGCGPEAQVTPRRITVGPVAAVHTALRASWITTAECVGGATYAASGEASFNAAPEATAGTEHTLLMLQLPAGAQVDYTLTCAGEDGVVGAVSGTTSTGFLPDGLSDFEVVGTPDEGPELLALSVLGAVNAAVLMDKQGRIVWYRVNAGSHEVTRARIGADGQSVIFNVAEGGITPSGSGEILRVGFDGAQIGSYDAPLNTHDFVELPDRSITTIQTDAREAGGETVIGDALLNVTETGESTVEWSAWDEFAPAVDVGTATTEVTWTRANALDYDPETDDYWLGLRNFDSISRIDRAEHHITESLGGTDPTIVYADPATATSGQHQFEWLPDGILIFDNGYATQVSRAVEYTLDDARTTLTQRWEWVPEPTIWNYALGDVHRDEDGGTLVTLSVAGEIVQLDAAGQVRWQLNADLGTAFGYADRVPPIAAPAE